MLTLGLVKYLIDEVLPNLKSKDSAICLSRSGIVPCDFNKITSYMQRNGMPPSPGPYTGKELLLDAGFKYYDDIDFVEDEGASIVHDLNQPLPPGYEHEDNKYDLVFECGTMEHIFDIAQVFKNMIQLCKVGGTICHISPLTWLNHGFYNFSLTLFNDVYRNNGFDSFKFGWCNWPQNYGVIGSTDVIPIEFTPSQILKPSNTDFLMIAFTAKKIADVPFKNPIQAAYDPELALNTPLRKHRD